MKIGNIELDGKVILAPMAGVCNSAFRKICKEMGASLVCAEMVSDKGMIYNSKKTEDMLYFEEVERPISQQIFGSDKETFTEAAKRVYEIMKPDIIDINMGCPAPKVVKNGDGSKLLLNLDLAEEIVKAVVEAVKKPVTVKIRIGWDFEHINCVENAKMIEKAGASAITVHGRTRSQFYQGKADWSYIKQVVEAVSIPVVGNGDIVDYKTAKEMLDYTGCQAIAIGRGSLGNPFIFREINEYLENGAILEKPTKKEIYDTIIRQHQMLVDLKGEHLAMLEMRSFVGWYLKGMPGSAKIKDTCNKQVDFNEVKKILIEYLN